MHKPLFGYEYTEEGNRIPVEGELQKLEEVKDMLDVKALSLRDAATYLSHETGRSISHEGLRKRLTKPVRLEA